MYLKALEIQGFKSFPDRTVLRFDKDITAIVGPNGSGKSNISDALLWVMGEQRSKALRGGKMEDVVFGGTEKRSPMGFAQVSLVLDNSQGLFSIDSQEVVITRRYYRNGDSEYYLNREAVRLRDIVSLLMDTGLGRDGYSVIGQGRIAEIVSAKNTDRREIFEEAAGISRFRYRKEEAERKLERTEENLLRVNDKIDELELQVGPLQKQAETAKKYLILRDEQRGLEISVWMCNLDRLQAQSQTLNLEYEAAKGNLAAAQRALEEVYAASENYSAKMRETDVESERLRELQSAAESAAAEAESAAAVLSAGLEHNRENIERARNEMNEQSGRAKALETQAQEQSARMEEIGNLLEQNAARTEATLNESEELARRTDRNRQGLSELMREETARSDELTQCGTEKSMRLERAEELRERRGSVETDCAAAEQKYEETCAALRQAEKRFSAARQRLDEINNKRKGHRMRISGREEAVRELTERLNRLVVDKRSTESRFRMLSDMEKEYEGMGKAVKSVMLSAERGVLRGIRGPVANLLTVPDQYAIAIETALGGAMQHIVVETQKDGKAAIEYLKRSDNGRDTFIPMDITRPMYLNRVPKGEPGYVGLASELVQCDAAYAGVFGNLLGRTVVAETLADAVQISRRFENRLRIVTLDGQMINAGGSMTGGSTARNVGILSRANELRQLRGKLESLKEEEKRVTETLAEAQRTLAQAKYEAEGTGTELDEATEELHRADSELGQSRVLRDALDTNLENLEQEKRNLSASEKENAARVAELEARQRELEESLRSLRERIAEASRGSEGFERSRAALTERLTELRTEAAALESERETAGRSLESLRQLLSALSGDSEQRRRSILEMQERAAELERDRTAQQQRAEEFRAQADARKAEIAALLQRKLELEGKRTRCDRQGQEKNREIMDLQSVCARYEQKKLSAELEEKQIVDKLWDSYELSRSAAQQQRQPVEDLPAATKRITELRREISRLGNVNLGAIEEYDRVSERYGFLKGQRDDVESAKRDLLKIINEITGEMKEIFLREFTAINEGFRNVFLELFGGGKAALELEDPENPLECGIEIRVQPPGKAVTTISLLSGGEKSFVAICLYFAIMKVRPTPFCVMDEIDAALDEANVERYARYMRTLSDKTQFITITHHRATMEEADVLYGVTMQEKGVTTVLAIDLEEAEKTIA